MSGGIEGEGRRGEPISHQPRQPEHMQPLQGRVEGKQSLQGPTTVDGSEQPKPLQEIAADKLRACLQESLGMSERERKLFDVNLSARRVIAGLHELELGRALDQVLSGGGTIESMEQLKRSHVELTGQQRDQEIIADTTANYRSYLMGLKDALRIITIARLLPERDDKS
jgi:hypothetical protein